MKTQATALMLLIFGFVFFLLIGVPLAAGEEKAAEKGKSAPEEEIQTGVIASFGRHSKTSSVDVGSTGEYGGAGNMPISASVSRDGNSCTVTVVNTSKENSYSVRYSVIGTSKSGQRLFKRSFTSSLRPEASIERNVSCTNDSNVSVELNSGNKL